MSNTIITRFENDIIAEYLPENAQLFEMLEDFVLRNSSEDRPVMLLSMENGRKVIKAAGYVGLIQLNNGTQIEIYPKVGDSPTEAKKILSRMISVYLGIPYSDTLEKTMSVPGTSFMEYFISVYIRECMKIMKSGMLSGYTSIEENSNTMQGSILFSENIRKNLTHRERLYVRHEVFTPDRSENRLMKTTAALMQKLSHDHQNIQNLKKILLFLDEVKLSDNCDADLANCINTRNSQKYNVVLNMSRLFLKTRSRKNFSGKYVSCALLFPMEEIFGAYAAEIARKKNKGKVVMLRQSGKYLCDEPDYFPLEPDIAVYDKNNRIESIIISRWKFIDSAQHIDRADVYRLFACAVRMGCENVFIIYPETKKVSGLPANGVFTVNCGTTVHIHIRFADPASEDEFKMIAATYEGDDIPETEASGEISENPIEKPETPEKAKSEDISENPKKELKEPEKEKSKEVPKDNEKKAVTRVEEKQPETPQPEKTEPTASKTVTKKKSDPEKAPDQSAKNDNSSKKVKITKLNTKSKSTK